MEILIAVAIIMLLLGVAIGNLLIARLSADEAAVIRELHTVHTAQVQYYSLYGNYAPALIDLGPPMNGRGANLIPASLASGEKNGYVFILTAVPGGFAVNANPKIFSKTGRRTFYLDQDGVVHQNLGSDPATAASPEIK